MKSQLLILVILSVGHCPTYGAKPTSRFPDFLAPLRSIFGSRPQPQHPPQHSPQGPPKEYQRPQGNKDQNIAETSKPNGENNFGEDTGFRPFFPQANSFEEQPSYSPGNGDGQYRPPQQQQAYNSPYPGQNNRPPPPQGLNSPPGRPRPPRQEQRPLYNRPPPFSNTNDERYPNSQEGSPDINFNPASFGNGFGQGQQQQPHFGHHGPPPNRFPPPGHRKPFQPSQPLNDFEGEITDRPQTSPFTSHQYAPQGFPESDGPGHQQYQPQGNGESQIITLDDFKNQGQNSYSNGQFNNGPFNGARPEFYPEQNNIFQNHGSPDANNNPIFQSNSLKPLVNHGPPSFSSNSEEAALFHEGSQQEKVTVKPGSRFRRFKQRRTPVQSASKNEDVHYGRPMMMSASTPSAVKKVKPPKNMHHNHKKSLEPRKPVLLSSPKIPNYIKSPSHHVPMTQPYEPSQAATNHGHGGGHGDLGSMTSNGDRILYHVAGHQGPYSYRFGYDTGHGYNRMFRHEEKDGTGYVKGKYGFYDKHGKLNIVNYEAHPEHGFHAEKGHK